MKRISVRMILVMALVALPLGSWGWSMLCGGWLAEARDRLSAMDSIGDPVERSREAYAAELLLTRYLRFGSMHQDAASARVLLGAAYAAQLNVDAAVGEVSAAELEHVSPADLATAALALFSTRRFQDADRLIAQALKSSEDRDRTLRIATVIHFDLGRETEVLRYCRELTELTPEDPNPWVVAAGVYESGQRWDMVIAAYGEILKRQPPPALAWRQNLVHFLLEDGRLDDARQLVDALRSAGPEAIKPVAVSEARLLKLESRPDAAMRVLTPWLARHPDDAAGLRMMADLKMTLDDPAAAVGLLKRTLQIRPFDHTALNMLVRACNQSGDTAQARIWSERHQSLVRDKERMFQLKRTAAREPGNAACRRDLAVLCRQFEELDQARRWELAAAAAESASAQGADQ